MTNRRHGGYGFPGGKVNAGEKPIEAAVREFREELGVELDAGQLIPIGRSTWGDGRIVHIFLARTMQGTPRQCEAETVPKWMKFADLLAQSPFASFYRDVFPVGVEHLHRTLIAW